MDERLAVLDTPEACERFMKNAMRLGRPDPTEAARRRAIELRAARYGASAQAERGGQGKARPARAPRCAGGASRSRVSNPGGAAGALLCSRTGVLI